MSSFLSTASSGRRAPRTALPARARARALRRPDLTITVAAVAGLLAAAMALFNAPAATAEVYRWVDENGVVNYGERKPSGAEARLVNPYTASAGAPAAAATVGAAAASEAPASEQPNLSESQRSMLAELEAAEASRKAAVAKLRTTNCATSQRVLKKLQARGRIRYKDANGEEVAMTDEDRDERVRQAQLSIATNCDATG